MTAKKFQYDLGKVGFSGAVAIGGLVLFILFFYTFFSGDFEIYQKIAVILLSILIITILLGGLWIFGSLRMMSKKWDIFKIKEFKRRIIVTIFYFFAHLIFFYL